MSIMRRLVKSRQRKPATSYLWAPIALYSKIAVDRHNMRQGLPANEYKKAQTWLKLSRLQLPSSVKFGLKEKVT